MRMVFCNRRSGVYLVTDARRLYRVFVPRSLVCALVPLHGSLEESWKFVLQHSKRLFKVLQHSDHLKMPINVLLCLLHSSCVAQLCALRVMAAEVEQHVAGIEVEGAPTLTELQLLRLVCVDGVAVIDALQPPLNDALLKRLLHNLPLLLGEAARAAMLKDDSPLVEVARQQVIHWVPHHVDVQRLWKAMRGLSEVDVVLVLHIHTASSRPGLFEEMSKPSSVVPGKVSVAMVLASQYQVTQLFSEGVEQLEQE